VKNGTFITFEGPEGGGKSTQIRMLAERLNKVGIRVLMTREPGGTATGEAIRKLLQHDSCDAELGHRTEVLLFCASRAQIVEQVIRPALARGEWVLCDRFVDSTLAYQGYGRGFALPELRALNNFATSGLMPDLTLLLDIPADESFKRLTARQTGVDRIERADRSFHERLRDGYLDLADSEPARWRVISTMQTIEQTAEDIWRAVSSQYPELGVKAPPQKS